MGNLNKKIEKLMTRTLGSTKLTASSKLLLLWLTARNGAEMTLSYATLSSELGVSPATAIAAVAELERAKLIRVTRERCRNTYKVL